MRTFLILIVACVLGACHKKKDDPLTEVPESLAPTGAVHFLLEPVFRTNDVDYVYDMFSDSASGFLSKRYKADNGDSLSVISCSYLVHKVVMFKTNGDSVELKDSAFVFKNSNDEHYTDLTIRNIPEGTYDRSTFYVGALDNQVQLQKIKKKAPELFLTGSDYLFFYVLGRYKNADTALAYPNEPARAWKKMELALANPGGERFQHKIECPFFAPITVESNKYAPYFHVRMDLRSLFGIMGRNETYDVQKNPVDTFYTSNAVLYKNLSVREKANKSFMFFYDHVH